MLSLKKSALAVIALGSTAAFAGTMGPVCSAVNVTVPCENTAWDFGGRALYLQATGSSFRGDAAITQGTNSFNVGSSPAWGWGFQLEGSYHYSTGNDFNLNWYHLRSGGTTNTLSSDVPFTFPIPVPEELSVDTVIKAGTSTSISPAWDQVNMEFGQHVDFGENKFARLHAGMNFSRVANSGYTYRLVTNDAGTRNLVNRTDNFSSVYNGFGPRVGMDLNYEWGNGLGIYGTGALSALAGTSKSSNLVSNWDVPAEGLNVSTSKSNIVAEIDAKLGAMYTYAMAQGDLSLDIGWVWAQYMSALVQADEQNFAEHNFGVQGLYFGMKWVGNVA